MRQLLRAAALAVLAFCVLPLFAADEVKKTDDKKTDDKKPVMVSAGSMTGKILNVDETKRTLKVRLEYPEVNQGEAQAIANDQRQIQVVLATEKNPTNRANRIAQLQQSIANHTAKLYKQSSKDVDLESIEEPKVRLANPTPKFDEKGNPIKYTAKELKELKGDDTKTVGYPAVFGDLRKDQIVKIDFVKKKGTPMLPKPTDPAKAKDVDKQTVDDLMSEYAPKMSMIVVLMDPPSAK